MIPIMLLSLVLTRNGGEQNIVVHTRPKERCWSSGMVYQGPVPETALSQRYLLAWRYLQFSATLKLAWR
jgi:hypothetical protein